MMLKFLQRRCYTFLNTSFGMLIFVVALWTLLYEALHLLSPAVNVMPTLMRPGDNIGGINRVESLAYGPIDAVYTWVNGSDTKWQQKKSHWRKHHLSDDQFSDSRNETTLNMTRSNTNHTHTNDTLVNSSKNISSNIINDEYRYRDSDELRYSIRSIVKNAPWLRRIYLVTDNQIPNWLNLDENIDRISIITHEGKSKCFFGPLQ